MLALLGISLAGARGQGVDVQVSDALGEGRDLVLALVVEDDRPVRGFGTGPRFNRMPYSVDVADDGALHVGIPSDGYQPPPGTRRTLTVRLDEEAGTAVVEEGEDVRQRSAAWKPSVLRPEVWRATLQLEHVLEARSANHRRLVLEMAGEGEAVTAVLARPPGSPTDVSANLRVIRHQLRAEADGGLTGRMEIERRRQGAMDVADTMTLVLDGQVVGSRAAGSVERLDSADAPPGAFLGRFEPAPPPDGDLDLRITLHGGIPGHQFLDLYLAVRDGAVAHGFGASPNYNNAIHTVDTSGLTWTDGRLRGSVAMVVQPDPWIPRDGRPVVCAYEIGAVLSHGLLDGRFQGVHDEASVDGPVEGLASAAVAQDSPAGRYTFKLERALAAQTAWHGRVFISLEADGEGNVTGGRISNNHSDLRGEVTGGAVRWDGDRIEADLRFRAERGRVAEGEYTARVTMQRAGGLTAGTFLCTAPDGSERTGTGWLAFRERE